MADAARGQFTGHVGENQELFVRNFYCAGNATVICHALLQAFS